MNFSARTMLGHSLQPLALLLISAPVVSLAQANVQISLASHSGGTYSYDISMSGCVGTCDIMHGQTATLSGMSGVISASVSSSSFLNECYSVTASSASAVSFSETGDPVGCSFSPSTYHAFQINSSSTSVGNIRYTITTAQGTFSGTTQGPVESAPASSASDLARAVVGAPYLWGGKGWNWDSSFATPGEIFSGYNYYDPNTSRVSFGQGLDCSGLVLWAYDKSSGASRYLQLSNRIAYEGADGQFAYNSIAIPAANLAAGDLLFFDWNGDGHMDHVAMFVGGDDVVQAVDVGIPIKLSSKATLLQKYAGKVFTRRVSPPVWSAQFVAHSPVTLAVTDPDGLTITADTRTVTSEEVLREIPRTMYYSTYAAGNDGSFEDMVTIPVLKQGGYLVHPVPRPGSQPNATYSLDLVTPSGTITLATSQPLSNIPVEGFGVLSTGAGIATFIPVTIEVGSINLSSNGRIPISILSSIDFDATTIDPDSIQVSGSPLSSRKNGSQMASFEDVNHDGRLDLVVHVPVQALQLNEAAPQVVVSGFTFSGKTVRGIAVVKAVP